MAELLKARALGNATCRVVAGYCWHWATRDTPGRGHDIEIGDWKARWNDALTRHGTVSRVCHESGTLSTPYRDSVRLCRRHHRWGSRLCQGSLRVRPPVQQYPALKASLRSAGKIDFARAIRNIYYVLLTRAKKGVFIYVVDPGEEVIKEALPEGKCSVERCRAKVGQVAMAESDQTAIEISLTDSSD